ncbi:NADP-specific glutamate dehydrogenase [Aeoliella sp. ICT_H6.2]|uniref:Glutamate dehydrogenase n=1 Tax=Aeoliella straminimaris TaxID=2954799 RepID=A0A9X2JJD4_9BACT|nr:NADP-specific glutamate dehydrogenase [Aeoliella straminimaris]MCO6048055.1 NADP-specific glutamate dehydrogenase [Aeoliella straminimaris]
MADDKDKALEHFMQGLKRRNPGQKEFHQAVQEFAESVMPVVVANPDYQHAQILERLTEPDRIITFRVTWQDDEGNVRVNRAWRVQFSNAIGPYKGGLRFHSDVTLSVLKFLGFEQIFKNSLTGLPMGGAKGGANFNPKGKSADEVMRFCQAMMCELHRHIGEDVDVPAGDIGVGAREISYLFGQYKRVANRYAGVLTGKGLAYGGSPVRTEATGYGCVYFCQNMLQHVDDSVEGKTTVVSGAGNVALYAIEKLVAMGANVVTASDSSGFVYDAEGMDEDKLAYLKDLKEVRRGRMSEYAERYKHAKYYEGKRPWGVECDIAMPCATQNEIGRDDAKALIDNGVRVVCEGANMPSELAAAHAFVKAKVLFGPAKAANAGGVAVSGLEQAQNAQRVTWSVEEVDHRLHGIMKDIHRRCVEEGGNHEYVNYALGANIAGFRKVAEALLAYGAI